MTRPDYYRVKLTDGRDLECFDVIEALEFDFNLGNVLKYLWRAGRKTPEGTADLKKALTYLERACGVEQPRVSGHRSEHHALIELRTERDDLAMQLRAAKASISTRDEQIENLVNARDEDAKKTAAIKHAVAKSKGEQIESLKRELVDAQHIIGAANASMRSAARRLGERYDGDADDDAAEVLASKVDEAVAGLLEDYECAKADAKPARTKKPKPADPPSLVGASAPPASDTPAESSTAVSSSPPAAKASEVAATGDDPFVIMRTIPAGRQFYNERDNTWGIHTGAPIERYATPAFTGFAKYADSLDAEAVKRSRNLRKTKVLRLSAALAPKVNAPRVEVIAQAGDGGPFVICTNTADKRSWLTTSAGLMCIPLFTEAQAAAEDGGDPIAEFELLEEARGAADDLAKSMPNAGGVSIVEVHDVGTLVHAEERKAAAE